METKNTWKTYNDEQLKAVDTFADEYRSFLDAGKRVARFLVSQAEYYGRPEDGGLCLTVRLTHQQLADFLGISRVAVSQCVRGLEKQGLMEKREGRFFLPNPAALREWSSPL